jgi:hypothetical protein
MLYSYTEGMFQYFLLSNILFPSPISHSPFKQTQEIKIGLFWRWVPVVRQAKIRESMGLIET